MLSVRKLKPTDKKRVVEICKDIWDGDDYLHLVFDQWVKDPEGEFIGAVSGGKIIGFIKLTMFSKHDAWIEGLRKDQNSTIRGVGRFLAEYLLAKLAENPDIRTIRFCTYFENLESIGLFTKLGFKILEKRNHKSYQLPNLKFIPQYKGNHTEIITDEKAVLNFFHKSRSAKYLKNGICLSWVVKPLSDELIVNEFVNTGQCVGIVKGNKIAALCFYTQRETNDLFISFFEADNDRSASQLLQKLKQIAYQTKRSILETILPLKDKNSYNIFNSFKFGSWEAEEDFLLFDYSLTLLNKK